MDGTKQNKKKKKDCETIPWENPIFNDWLENDESTKKEKGGQQFFCLFEDF